MAHVMSFKDGRCEPIFSGRDFSYFVDEYMGSEAADYVMELAGTVDSFEAKNEELEKTYEQDMDELRESRHEILMNFREMAEELLDLLSAPRMDREKARRAAGEIYRLADNEL